MGFGFSAWSIILATLFLLMLVAPNNGRKTNHREWKEEEEGENRVNRGNQEQRRRNHYILKNPTSDHIMDPSVNVFFTLKDLKIGNKLEIYFDINKNPSKSPHLLPRKECESIPFSTRQLPYLLNFFSFSKNSTQAKAMEYTLNQCELKPLKEETKFCSTSLESMLDSTRTLFGLNSEFKLLTTKFLKKPTTLLQSYTVLEIEKGRFGNGMIGCHTMPYPYAVFYCHSQKQSKTRVFQVLLGGEDGESMVKAVAVCHMDTSKWDKDHISFKVLKIEPGKSPVCHFFPVDNLVWVRVIPGI